MSSLTLKINPEYESLVPPLDNQTYDSLVESIRINGQRDDIAINGKGEVLDGHHRFRACREIRIEPKYYIKNFDDILQEKLYVIDTNLQRRQLTVAQRVQLVLRKKPILQELARKHMSEAGKGIQICTPLGRVNNSLAKEASTSASNFYKIETILEKAPEDVKSRVLLGKTRVDKAYRKMQLEEARQEAFAEAALLEANLAMSKDKNKPYQLIEGDFREEGKGIESNSIPLLLVDSMYYEDSLNLHKDLSRLADRVLRPGGCYAVYLVPQWRESTIRDYITKNSNLKECGSWTVEMQGQYGSDHNMHMFYQSKEIGWYCKGDKPINPLFKEGRKMFNVIRSRTPDKRRSKYTQSPIEAEYIIRNLTAPNDLVLDPMMGEGTTGVAALKLKRRFIGIEINPETVKLAKANILRELQ